MKPEPLPQRESQFETLLWRARLFVLIPVVFTLIAAVAASVEGAATVVQGVIAGFLGHTNESTLWFLQGLDIFLLATILYVGSIGLYELFISRLEPPPGNGPRRLPSWMVIRTVDDLKQKVASVVTIVIAITYLSELSRWAEGESTLLRSSLDALWLSLGVSAAMLSLIFFARRIGEQEGHRPGSEESAG
ncbi:MAG: YqhA family protein [bacterium]|nr:YqhA family protein [bacterium]